MIIIKVVAIIFLAGVMGGYVNYALGRTANSKWHDIWWSVVIGLGAAFLIPLFLNTISSSLLSGILDGSSKQADWFVFFGFCLLGAIASRTMIQTLTQKVLRTAEEAKQEVKKLKEEVDPIIIKETEPVIKEAEPEIAEQPRGGDRLQGYGLVGEDPPKIIKVLGGSKYSRRTVQGIQKEAKVPREKVYELLSWLQMNGLAVTTGEPNNYWSLTEKGRSVFANTIKEKA
mgnify:CR=1 FL=1